MKRTLFTILLILLFVSTVYLPLVYAQDPSTWGLPEGAKLRLGRGPILDIVHVPDSTRLAALTRNGIWLYDTTSGEAVDLLTLKSYTGPYAPGNLEYSADGQIFAFTAGSIVHLCNASTGETLTTHEFEGSASGLRLSRDGQTFFIRISLNGFPSGATYHVNASTGETIQIPADEGRGRVHRIHLSPDDTTYATTQQSNNQINLWDTSTHEHIMRIPRVDGAFSPPLVDFSPDSTTVAVAYFFADNSVNVRLYEVSTSENIATFDAEFDSQIRDIIFSAGGQIFVVVEQRLQQDVTVNLWAVSTSETTLTYAFDGFYGGQLQSLPDGRTSVITHNNFNDALIWDVSTGENIAILTKHPEQLNNSISFSPDGTSLASTGLRSVFLWDVPTAENTARFFEQRLDFTQSVSHSPDGTTLAVGSNWTWVYLLNASTVETITHFKVTDPEKQGFWECIATYSPDGTTLASASRDSKIRLWDTSTFENIATLIGHTDGIGSVAFSPDGTTLASASRDKTIRLWDASTFENIATLTGHTDVVHSVAFSPDGTTLASGSGDSTTLGSGDHTIRLWDTSTFENIATLTGHTDAVVSVAFSPDGTTLASGSGDSTTLGSGDHTIRLWDTSTFENIATLTGHTDAVVSVAFSPDGTTLASGSGDSTIHLWDTSTFENIATLTGHTSGIGSIAYSPDGTTLASGSGDGTILLWDVRPPAPEKLAEDVNADGTVNIQDLVLIASNFGATGENPADVNGDGVVNIQDLVQVAGQIGTGDSAPSAWEHNFEGLLTRAEVARWLAEAEQLNRIGVTAQRGIRFLESLLAALTPKETALLSNYPNPFNPETWIPYQLGEPAEVRVTIYAADSTTVRTLMLGHQTVGIYQDKSRAAYWDGKNEIGEAVASGVYFYTLTAGDFSATRKMLIRK